MKYFVFLLIVSFSLIGAQDFPDGEVAAKVNGEIITQKELVKDLEKRYGPDAADGLQMNVIRSVLEEKITFKLIEQFLRGKNIRCLKSDYMEDVDRFEKPFFAYYQKWATRNQITFLKNTLAVIKKDRALYKKYNKFVKAVTSHRVLRITGKEITDIWKDLLEKRKLKNIIRKIIFEKYHIDYGIFKRKIMLMTKFRKYVEKNTSQKEIRAFAKKENFALSGGNVQISHILLRIIDEDTKELMSEKKQKLVLKRANLIRKLIKPDLSNFSKIAEKYSEDKVSKYKSGKLLGFVPRWTAFRVFGGFVYHLGRYPHWTSFAENVVNEAYRLPIKKLSKPVKSKVGYHIIFVRKRNKGKPLTPKVLLKLAKERYILFKMEKMMREWYEKAKIERKI